MKKNGFLSSALLYGIIALFVVIMLTTIAILGNRKLSTDKLKSNALDTVQSGYVLQDKIYAIYDSYRQPEQSGSSYIWRDQSENGHNATLVNFSSSYYANRAIKFNGSSYIDTGIPLSDLGDDFTITMVFELSTNVTSVGILGDYSDNQGILLEIANSSVTKACYYGEYTDSTNSVVQLQTCSAVPTTNITSGGSTYTGLYNNKVELTLVYQSGIGVYVYRNGVRINYEVDGEEFSDSFSRTMKVGNNNLVFGRSSSSNSKMFVGDLYSIVIYKGAISGSEVAENYAYNMEKYEITT